MAISLTVALGFGMIIPVFPTFARSFGVGLAAIGLVQLVFGFTRFSFGIVGGLLVDRFGDRACTMAGLLIVSLSSYAVGFADSFTQLVLARGFGGAGSAFFIAGLQTRILRIIEPASMGRATGIFASSFLVGIAVGPPLGGFVGELLGTVAVFHIYATGLILATAIAWFVMAGAARDIEAERKRPIEALRAARPLFRDRRYVVALLATFVGWWTISGPAQTVGVVFAKEVLGFSSSTRGLAFVLLAVGELLILFVSGRAADRYGRRAVLIPSLVVTTFGLVALGQAESAPWTFFVVMLILGGGIAAGRTAAGGLLADSIPKGGSGAAVGVNQMAGDLGAMTSPTAIGFIAETASYGSAYVVAAVPAAAVLVAAVRLSRGPEVGADEEPVPAETNPEPGITSL